MSQWMGGGGCDGWDTDRKRGRAQIFEGRGTRRCIWMRMGRATKTCKLAGRKAPWDRQRMLPIQGCGGTEGRCSTGGRRHISKRPGRAWTRQRWTQSPKKGWGSFKHSRTVKPRLTVTSRAEDKGRVDPEAPQFCHRRGRLCLSRRAGDLRYPPRPTHPGGRPYLAGPGAPGWGCWGRGCALEAREEGCERRRRPLRGSDWEGAPHPLWPPRRLTQGRGRGGGGFCLRLAVKSGSCSSLGRAHAARAALLPTPASGSAAGLPAAATPILEPPRPAPDSPQPQREAAGTAATRPSTRKLFRRRPRRCEGE